MTKLFTIPVDALKNIIPKNKSPEKWALLLSEHLSESDLTDRDVVAAFIAQCAHESSQFNVLEENLNYSKTNLKKTFGKYFKEAEYAQFARKPEQIANRVYANRNGNGTEGSGDGWKFRGHGVIQLTGRDNITRFGESKSMSPDEALAYLKTDEGALQGAIWFWKVNKLSNYIDDFKELTRRINGGYNGLADREKYLANAQQHLPHELWFTSDGETSSVPAEDRHEQVASAVAPPVEKRSIIRLFSFGEEVKILKWLLKTLGFTSDGDEKMFDKKTFKAVQEVQRESGLQSTGIVDTETWSALEKKLREQNGR